MKVTKKTLSPYLVEIIKHFIKEGVEIEPLPKLKLVRDQKNADIPLGKTGYYDPNNKSISIYVTDRHVKDILRTFAHELVHHNQIMAYGIDGVNTENVNNDKTLEKMEADAYLRGNMLFRSWADSYKGVK